MRKWKMVLLTAMSVLLISGSCTVNAGEKEDALGAYADFVRSESYFSSFSLFDINGDGIQELNVGGDAGYGFYTYYNGKVQDVGFGGKAELEICWPETGLVRYFRAYKQGYTWSQYYVLKDGTLQLLCSDTDHVEFMDGWGNPISEQEYNAILEKYQVGSSFKPFEEWHDITKENIDIYLLGSFSGFENVEGLYQGTQQEVGNEAGQDYSAFLLPQSSTRYLTEADIEGFTLQELSYARNELAARYGRKFKSGELTAYFNTRSWYTPTMEAAYYDSLLPGLLNEYENWNSEFLTSHEKNAAHPNGYTLDQPGYDITKVRTFRSASSPLPAQGAVG